MITVTVVDGSRIFGDSIAARLAAEPDIRVLGTATRRGPAAEPVEDVLVCDAALFDLTGPGAGGRPATVLVADHCDRHRLCPAVRVGVRAWVPREASADDLLSAVREVAGGGSWIPARLLTGILDELTSAPSRQDPARRLLERLTPRERDVLTCLAAGLARSDAAAALNLSTNTVRTHVQSILAKLGVNSSVAAVALARRGGLVPGPPSRGTPAGPPADGPQWRVGPRRRRPDTG